VRTLQSDPSSILSYMVLKQSPMKPYSVDNIYTYFLDRDPRHFVHILKIGLMTGRFVKLEHMFQTWNHRHSKWCAIFGTLPWFLIVICA
jgi:hypothetical protein